MDMQIFTLPLTLGASDEMGQIALVGGLLIAALGITVSFVRRVLKHRETEKTRREIAAYVAEGSIKPEDAVKLMQASSKKKDDDEDE
ncbi:MAG: hypothetical protein IBJ18_08360 [Phycisphaerales bacterium]|nr:hypothetical protein [Phycisphaerales bacterium]